MSKSAKIGTPQEPQEDDIEHPEDRASRIEGEQYATSHAAEFSAKRADRLLAMIATYGDGDAQTLLENLREEFWARVWEPGKP